MTERQKLVQKARSGLSESLGDVARLLRTDPQLAAARAALVLKRFPAQREALALLIDSRRLTNEIPAARNFLRAQSSAYPKLAAYHYVLGVLFAEEGNFDSAIESFSRVTQLEPKNHKAWQALADILSENGRMREAGEAYGKALRLRRAPNPC